jgi:hypothetical protein
VLSFSDLDTACDVAIDIARAFTATQPCDSCRLSAQLAFGERLAPNGLQFWVTTRCLHCGAQVESDGFGSLPANLRELELQRRGTWTVLAKPPAAPVQWSVLRRELELDLPELAKLKAALPGSVFLGTFAEASRLCTALTNADILADLEQAG